MIQKVTTDNRHGGRPEIDIAYQDKIWEVMIDFSLEHRYSEVHARIQEWAKVKQVAQASWHPDFREEEWNYPPSKKTVQRYVERFRKDPPIPRAKRKQFRYPDDMDLIGWEHSRTALDCLRFYLSKYDARPPVGLVQWFCRMAIARRSALADPNPDSVELHQIGLYAEVCWFRDLVSAMGKGVPNATKLELSLAWETWKKRDDGPSYVSAAETHGISPDGPLVGIRKDHLRLLTEMPIFMETFKTSPYFSQERDGEERNDA